MRMKKILLFLLLFVSTTWFAEAKEMCAFIEKELDLYHHEIKYSPDWDEYAYKNNNKKLIKNGKEIWWKYSYIWDFVYWSSSQEFAYEAILDGKNIIVKNWIEINSPEYYWYSSPRFSPNGKQFIYQVAKNNKWYVINNWVESNIWYEYLESDINDNEYFFSDNWSMTFVWKNNWLEYIVKNWIESKWYDNVYISSSDIQNSIYLVLKNWKIFLVKNWVEDNEWFKIESTQDFKSIKSSKDWTINWFMFRVNWKWYLKIFNKKLILLWDFKNLDVFSFNSKNWKDYTYVARDKNDNSYMFLGGKNHEGITSFTYSHDYSWLSYIKNNQLYKDDILVEWENKISKYNYIKDSEKIAFIWSNDSELIISIDGIEKIYKQWRYDSDTIVTMRLYYWSSDFKNFIIKQENSIFLEDNTVNLIWNDISSKEYNKIHFNSKNLGNLLYLTNDKIRFTAERWDKKYLIANDCENNKKNQGSQISKWKLIKQKLISKKNIVNSKFGQWYIVKLDVIVEKIDEARLKLILLKLQQIPLELKNKSKYKNIFNYLEAKILLKLHY